MSNLFEEVGEFVGDLTGANKAADASLQASDTQAQVGREAIQFQRDQINRLIDLQDPFRQFGLGNVSNLDAAINQRPRTGDLSRIRSLVGNNNPFLDSFESAASQANPLLNILNQQLEVGAENQNLGRLNSALGSMSRGPALNRLTALTTDPNAQRDFIQNNPFYNTLADQAQDRIFNNQAARGKLGSGETAAGLQNELVRLGSDLLNREVAGLQGAASADLGFTNSQIGNLAQGAGLESNINTQGISNLLSGAGLNANINNQQAANFLSGAGLLENINNQDIGNLFGLFGAEQGIQQNTINNLFNAVGLGQNASALQGNAITGAGGQITDLMTGIGNARAAGIVGAGNAQAQGFNNLVNLGLGVGGFLASDRRAKDIIENVGTWVSEKTKNVYETYLYKYKGMDELFIGVIADEVEVINPGAVAEHGGIKFVNYGAL